MLFEVYNDAVSGHLKADKVWYYTLENLSRKVANI